MAIFNKGNKEIDLGLNYLNELLIKQVNDWSRFVELSLTAKAASELPVERLEPFVRDLWIECYARSIVMTGLVNLRYQQVCEITPIIREIVPQAKLNESISNQARQMGEILGGVVRQIILLNEDHKPGLESHLDEPLLSELQAESKIRAAEHLKN
jgi:hypothetical protein